MKTKCDSLMKGINITHVYLNKKGLKFLLDDDLVEHLDNHQIFDIELNEYTDQPDKFDMTMTEVQV